jgi:hypothetical protein
VTGWKFEYIDDLPFPDVMELLEYWLENPPMHLLHKWFVGYKHRGRKGGRLNEFERAALPSESQVIPASQVPHYVQEAMKRSAEEKLRAR